MKDEKWVNFGVHFSLDRTLATLYLLPSIRTPASGPLYVLWQVSFGCWVTWSISSWQNFDKSVYFPKAVWWVAELNFLSLNNWGLNFLQNEFSQSSQIYLSQEKLRKMFTFSILKWLFAELSKMTTIFTQNTPWMSFEWKVVSFCEFAKLCKQLFLSKLEKNHVTQLTGFSCQNTKWGPILIPTIFSKNYLKVSKLYVQKG